MASDLSRQEFWFEDTIRSNPVTFFGVWTPEGWKTHRKIPAQTRSETALFSGDGGRTEFPGLPSDMLRTVHDETDSHTDNGIYPAEPRVEYPPGTPRWAISHTYLAYPHADQTLYSQEYTIDYENGNLITHFRRHVAIEEAVTDADNGMTVQVRCRPLSGVVVGNRSYPYENSAVRGVWSSASKEGKNFYLKPRLKLCRSLNAVYIPVEETPVVQCHGVWKAEAADLLAFDAKGDCVDPERLMANGIPLDCPKLGSVGYRAVSVPSRFYEDDVELMAPEDLRVEEAWLDRLKACQNYPFMEHQVGYAGWGKWRHWDHIFGQEGSYAVHWDFNDNGVVDAEDEAMLKANIGREVRPNHYTAAYFGHDWLSSGLLLDAEMHRHVPVVCSWSQGAGYASNEGVINLFETPGPNQRVFVEYHFDAPAECGVENVKLRYRKNF